MLSRWRREQQQDGAKAFQDQGKARDEEMTAQVRDGTGEKGTGFFATSGNVLRESVEMRYRMIERCRDAFPIRLMCHCLNVSPGGIYGWGDRSLSARAKENQRLLGRIRSLHTHGDGVLGGPRIWDDLCHEDETCSLNRVARLMQDNDIRDIPQKMHWRKMASKQRPASIQNHLERNFRADEPNTTWVTDITHIDTDEDLLYLSAVLYLQSGIVVGCSMSHRQTRELVLQAVLMPLWHAKIAHRSYCIRIGAVSSPAVNTSAPSRATTWSAA